MSTQLPVVLAATGLSTRERVMNWVQQPLGSVVAASIATMSTLGMVFSGSWLNSLALQ